MIVLFFSPGTILLFLLFLHYTYFDHQQNLWNKSELHLSFIINEGKYLKMDRKLCGCHSGYWSTVLFMDFWPSFWVFPPKDLLLKVAKKIVRLLVQYVQIWKLSSDSAGHKIWNNLSRNWTFTLKRKWFVQNFKHLK